MPRSSLQWSRALSSAEITGVGLNLSAVTWNATPILSQRIILTSVPSIETFGITIGRSIQVVSGTPTDTLISTQIVYGATAGATGPTSANFALRARLIRFDTENTPAAQSGFIALRGLDVASEASDAGLLGKAIIESTH